MKFPFYIAQRYLKSKSGNNIINIVTLLACLGVVAGTVSLFLVLSVFSGIKEYSLGMLNQYTPHIRIAPLQGKTFVANSEFNTILNESPALLTYTKVLEERAFFKHQEKEAIAFVKGIDSLYTKTIPLDSLLVVGEWFAPESNNSCITSYKLALELDLNVYTDRLLTYVPKTGKGYITNPKNAFRSKNPQIIGVFSKQQQDREEVYMPLVLTQQLLGKKSNEISYVDIKLNQLKDIKQAVSYFKSQLPNYNIIKREELNSSFYKILNSERLIAYLVSLLVVVMVLSNTSGTLIMVIVDKKNDIKTLLNLGATLQSIRNIYTFYGFLLTLFGMLIGLLLGTALVYAQLHFSLVMITPTIPYPLAFEWQNILIVCVTIAFFGALASLLASGRISKKFIYKR